MHIEGHKIQIFSLFNECRFTKCYEEYKNQRIFLKRIKNIPPYAQISLTYAILMLPTVPQQYMQVCFSWIINASEISAIQPQSPTMFITDSIPIDIHKIPLYCINFVNKAGITFLPLSIYSCTVPYTINLESGLTPVRTF